MPNETKTYLIVTSTRRATGTTAVWPSKGRRNTLQRGLGVAKNNKKGLDQRMAELDAVKLSYRGLNFASDDAAWEYCEAAETLLNN